MITSDPSMHIMSACYTGRLANEAGCANKCSLHTHLRGHSARYHSH